MLDADFWRGIKGVINDVHEQAGTRPGQIPPAPKGGDLIATGGDVSDSAFTSSGRKEPEHWRNDPKARIQRFPSQVEKPADVGQARETFLSSQARRKAQEDEQRQQARATFNALKDEPDFRERAIEEYAVSYMQQGGRIGSPSPYAETMEPLLREYLGRDGLREAQALAERLAEERARNRRWQ